MYTAAVWKDSRRASWVGDVLLTEAQSANSGAGTLVPESADEAIALIPSLERKIEQETITTEELNEMCNNLQRLKRQAELGS